MRLANNKLRLLNPAGFIYDAKDHLDYAVSRGWVDFERGAKVAGAKFYYLKGDLALLENAES